MSDSFHVWKSTFECRIQYIFEPGNQNKCKISLKSKRYMNTSIEPNNNVVYIYLYTLVMTKTEL